MADGGGAGGSPPSGSPGSGGGGGGGAAGEDGLLVVREQDRYLPVANISRIMRRVLPPNAKVTKEAKEAIQEGVSEFIAFLTSEAADKCAAERRKTIGGDDVLWGVATLGLEAYVEPLRLYLAKYREAMKSATSSAAGTGTGTGTASAASPGAGAGPGSAGGSAGGGAASPGGGGGAAAGAAAAGGSGAGGR